MFAEKNKYEKNFEILISNGDEKWHVYHPASLENPISNSVMFITEQNIDKANILMGIEKCIVFCPINYKPSKEMCKRHKMILCDSPRLDYARFLRRIILVICLYKRLGGL